MTLGEKFSEQGEVGTERCLVLYIAYLRLHISCKCLPPQNKVTKPGGSVTFVEVRLNN